MNRSTSVAEAISQHLGPTLASTGAEIEDVTVQPVGKRRLVRVIVARDVSALPDDDSPVPPLSLDEVAELTRAVSTALDDSDVMGNAPYTLEVSSPGVGQPLQRYAQYRRNVGRLLALTWTDGRPPSTERLLSATPEGIRTDTDPERVVAYPDIATATVEIEFNKHATTKDAREDR